MAAFSVAQTQPSLSFIAIKLLYSGFGAVLARLQDVNIDKFCLLSLENSA